MIFGLTIQVELEGESGDLTQSDVNELLDAIRAGGDIDVIREAVELVLQALIARIRARDLVR